jgi:hypothetical protein
MLKYTKNLCFAAFSAAWLASGAGASLAQTGPFEGCDCVTPPSSGLQTLGVINVPVGEVLYTGQTGLDTANQGSPLVDGSQMSTGQASSANIQVGQRCNLTIPARSEVLVTQPRGVGGDICVRITEKGGFANLPSGTGSSILGDVGFLTEAGIFAAFLSGPLIVNLLDEDPVSD